MRIRRRVIARRRLLPRRLRYHPAARGVVLIALVGVLFGVEQHGAAGAAAERHRWGDTRPIAVATRRIAIGETVDGDVAVQRTWPVALVPDGALEAVPLGRTAIATIEPGEAVLASRIAPDGLHGIPALVPPGFRALAVPVAPTVIALSVGDRVDLIAGFDTAGVSGDRSPSLTVARDAIVVAVDDKRVTVAVHGDDVERVAFAIVAGTVVPALRVPG